MGFGAKPQLKKFFGIAASQAATFLSFWCFGLLSTARASLLQVSSIRIGKDYGEVGLFWCNDLQAKSGAISPYWWGHFTVEVGPIHRFKGGHFTVDNLLESTRFCAKVRLWEVGPFHRPQRGAGLGIEEAARLSTSYVTKWGHFTVVL